MKHPAAILIFRKTDILTSAAIQTAANPEYRNSLNVPIGLTVPTDSSCYIFVTSITTDSTLSNSGGVVLGQFIILSTGHPRNAR